MRDECKKGEGEKGDVCSPGSLNAMWPSSPMPPRKSSMPPYFLILASYSLHSSIKFFALPFKMLTCEGGISTRFVGLVLARSACA